jgi:hypothetical protein
MSTIAITNVALPTDLAQELERNAKRFGLSLPAYLAFLFRGAARQHDAESVSALRYVLSKYPNALQRLAL